MLLIKLFKMSYRKHTLLTSTKCQERDSEKEKETKTNNDKSTCKILF